MNAKSTEIKKILTIKLFPVLLLLFQMAMGTVVSASNVPSKSYPTDFPILIVDGETKEPLIGATVINRTQNPKGGQGVVADIEGKVVLKNPGHWDIIEVSYLGYARQKIVFNKIRSNKWRVELFEDAEVLGITVVVTGRKDQSTDEIPYEIKRISSKEIAFLNSQTSADILLEAGAYIQKSQMGGGSPNLRGFEANRVLLVVDGVRMNNAIYRSGHLQNSISIDNAILEQAEVIYGPGALMYGSDALGGVVHYKTRDPKLHFARDGKDYQFTTNAFTRFSTANKEKAFHVDVDYGTDTWGSLSSVTYVDFDELMAGGNRPEGYDNYGKQKFFIKRTEGIDQIFDGVTNPNLQNGTGYSQVDFLQKIKFQPSEKLYFVLNLQYSTTSNVPRYDTLLDTLGTAKELKWAEWYYGPQQRMLASLKTKITKKTALFDKATFIASFQRMDEDRLKRKFRKTFRTFNLEDVYVYGFTADFDKYLDKNEQHTFSYGLEGNYNQVYSSAGRMNVNSGGVIYDELSRYPSGGGTLKTYAGYATYNFQSEDKALNFNFGGRFNSNEIYFDYQDSDAAIIDWPATYYDGITINNKAVNWGIGLTYHSEDRWQFKAVTSTAFRAPNLDDLAKVRPKNGKATVPNPDLKPEYSLNYEATIGKQFGALNLDKKGTYLLLSGTGFYTELTDAIIRKKGQLPDGSTTIVIDGDPHEVQQNFNASEAFIYGLSGNLEFNWNDRVILRSGINYTKGRRLFKDPEQSFDTLVPFDHIAPLYGRASLTFKTEKFRIEGLLRFNGAKPASEYAVDITYIDQERTYNFDQEGLSDNIEYGLIDIDPDSGDVIYKGLPAWVTYNVYAGYQFSKDFSINVGLENITDIHYRTFGSSISAPGRNFSIALRGKF